jgi:hypothetical protein
MKGRRNRFFRGTQGTGSPTSNASRAPMLCYVVIWREGKADHTNVEDGLVGLLGVSVEVALLSGEEVSVCL